jgi:hypothetical protein
MPTQVYKTSYVRTMDGVEIEVSPLKIKHLKKLMSVFSSINNVNTEDERFDVIVECVRIAMIQFYPRFSKNTEDIEENFDIKTLYKTLEYASGIKLRKENGQDAEPLPENIDEGTPTTWEDLDLAQLESDVFLLGIWKNYDELESSLCLEELMKLLSTIRELDYEEKKFLAALKGIDLDEQSGKNAGKKRGQSEWEDLKAKVFSGGKTEDANDVLSLQGANAARAGFGIGMGLGYTDLRDPSVML